MRRRFTEFTVQTVEDGVAIIGPEIGHGELTAYIEVAVYSIDELIAALRRAKEELGCSSDSIASSPAA